MARRGRWGRPALALASLLLCLLALEGALRWVSPSLPSLAPLQDPDARLKPDLRRPPFEPLPPEAWSDFCQVEAQFNLRPVRWTRRMEGAAQGAPLRVLAVGDSLTLGVGVEPEESFAFLLAAHLGQRLERPVQIDNIAVNGGHYCEYLREMHGWLHHQRPDLVLLGVYEDDLEARGMLLLDGGLVAFPDRVANPALRAVVGHSWLANRVWMAWTARAGSGPQRFISPEGQRHFRQAMHIAARRLQDAGIPLFGVLLGPAGSALCADNPQLADEYRWLADDGALLASLLRQAGVSFVDRRTFWDTHPGHLLPQEVQDMARRHRLPTHPDAEGHRLLAESMFSGLDDVIGL